MVNISRFTVPRSDQLNGEDLLSGPRTVTVVAAGYGKDEKQPIAVTTDIYGAERPYKPCKTMLKLLQHTWGEETDDWVGRSMTLYFDPNVMFGNDKIGGIRISHLSHIDRKMDFSFITKKGKRAPFTVQPLAGE